jgi:hypothetical protein
LERTVQLLPKQLTRPVEHVALLLRGEPVAFELLLGM